MNRIYWDIDKIAMLTDCMNASPHRHGMIQFFLCLEEQLEIKVAGEKITCPGIVVNKNVRHAFKANGKRHLTVVYEPVSQIGRKVSQRLDGKDYFILHETDALELKNAALPMPEHFDQTSYRSFMKTMKDCFGVEQEKESLDERITKLFTLLEHCDCEEHLIEHYASEVCLSPSRLSHLFSEQVGISLKSYLTLHQLERAFQDLIAGKKITEAALNAGFDSASHFAATVKKWMGLSAGKTLKDSEFLKVY